MFYDINTEYQIKQPQFVRNGSNFCITVQIAGIKGSLRVIVCGKRDSFRHINTCNTAMRKKFSEFRCRPTTDIEQRVCVCVCVCV